MKGHTYRLFVNTNTAGKNKSLRLPTAPMFLQHKYELDKVMYRLESLSTDATDGDFDNKVVVVKLNIPSETVIDKAITDGAKPHLDIEGYGSVMFLAPPVIDATSNRTFVRSADNGCIGGSPWGNNIDITIELIDMDDGTTSELVKDTSVVMEFSLEMLPHC
tara:strand:+ start:6107 stop:6592 length:486 start_codon:yes stop_codon:yes gene_type:complete